MDIIGVGVGGSERARAAPVLVQPSLYCIDAIHLNEGHVILHFRCCRGCVVHKKQIHRGSTNQKDSKLLNGTFKDVNSKFHIHHQSQKK